MHWARELVQQGPLAEYVSGELFPGSAGGLLLGVAPGAAQAGSVAVRLAAAVGGCSPAAQVGCCRTCIALCSACSQLLPGSIGGCALCGCAFTSCAWATHAAEEQDASTGAASFILQCCGPTLQASSSGAAAPPPAFAVESDAAIDEYIRGSIHSSNAIVGTCKVSGRVGGFSIIIVAGRTRQCCLCSFRFKQHT